MSIEDDSMIEQWIAENLNSLALLAVVLGVNLIKKLTDEIMDEPGVYECMNTHDKFWFDRVISWTRATTDYAIKHRSDFNLSEFKKYLIRSGKREVIDGSADKLVESFVQPKFKEGLSLKIDPFGKEKSVKVGFGFRF